MSRLPKIILLLVLVAVLLLPAIISPLLRIIGPAKSNVLSGYQVEAVAQNLDHPTLLTFDQTGRILVVESGPDPRVVRLDPSGVQARLTAPNVFGKALPITSVLAVNERIYVGHGGVVSIIKPDGTLDTISNPATQPPSTLPSSSTPDTQIAQELGIVPAASAAGPDGATYLADLGRNGNDGSIWKVVKAEPGATSIPPNGMAILVMSVVMILVAVVILLRPILRRSFLVIKVGAVRLKQLRTVQLTKVSA